MSLAVFTDSTTAHASPAFTWRPTAGSSTKTTSVSSCCAWSVMPTTPVWPLTRTHSCDLAYLRSEGMLLIVGPNLQRQYDNTEISLHPMAPARSQGQQVGRVTPGAPQTRIRLPSGAPGVTRPTLTCIEISLSRH